MTELYKNLESKNFWYKKYLACTEAFLLAVRHAPEIALDELELFYGNRESLLKIMDSIDEKIEAAASSERKNGREFNTAETTKIQFYLREKDSIVQKIIALDKELMTEIEALRAKREEKIKLLAKGNRALAKYRSAGEGSEKIDKRI